MPPNTGSTVSYFIFTGCDGTLIAVKMTENYPAEVNNVDISAEIIQFTRI